MDCVRACIVILYTHTHTQVKKCLPGIRLKWSCGENLLSIYKSESKSTSTVQFPKWLPSRVKRFPPSIDWNQLTFSVPHGVRLFYPAATFLSQSCVQALLLTLGLWLVPVWTQALSNGNTFFVRCQFPSHF